MIACDINTKSDKFQTLKNKSGVSDFTLASAIADSQNNLGRDPYLDEIPKANSENYLKEHIKLKKNNYTDTKNILDYTNTASIEEATIKLNNQMHQDLEVTIQEVGSKSLVTIRKRPSEYEVILKPYVDTQENVTPSKNTMIFRKMLDTFADKYGINIKYMNTKEILALGIPNATISKAFIYNGDIYVNTDVANVTTSKAHELMHIFLGSVKFLNPELYYSLVSTMEDLNVYDTIAKNYPNRTRNDINEEIFVTEFSKHITGVSSIFQNLDAKISKELEYNVLRMMDSMLMGNYSVKSLSNPYSKTILELAKLTQSEALNQADSGYIQYSSKINRQLANLKEQLYKENKLMEKCR